MFCRFIFLGAGPGPRGARSRRGEINPRRAPGSGYNGKRAPDGRSPGSGALNEYLRVEEKIGRIETELKRLGLWDAARPDEEAFASGVPFGMDAMEFHVWLRYVLIERFRAIVASRGPLPREVRIFPYAAVVYRGRLREHRELLRAIRELDDLFGGG